MTSLFHFEDKVHRRNLTRAESLPLLFSRLLCQVLEHIGFPAQPRLECCQHCEAILTDDRWHLLPRAQNLPPQDIAEDIAFDHPVEDTEEPQIEPSAASAVTTPLLTSSASYAPLVPPTPTASIGPSTSAPTPQHISISTRDFLAIMDAVCTFSTMSASFGAPHTALAERMTRTEAAVAQTTSLLEQNHAILMKIQSHLGLPPISPSVPAQASSDHPPATATTDSPPASSAAP